jgi:4,5-dihydroxyphthalate decarboxylase
MRRVPEYEGLAGAQRGYEIRQVRRRVRHGRAQDRMVTAVCRAHHEQRAALGQNGRIELRRTLADDAEEHAVFATLLGNSGNGAAGRAEAGAAVARCVIGRFARGDCSFVALPVFPSRVFRHGYIYIYVNRRSGIKVPKHLEHRRVGVALYTQTAAVWIRGHLAHQYGVDLSTIRWIEGAVEKGGPHGNPHAPPLLKPVAIERNSSGRSLSELLAAGEIDALAAARHPQPHPDVIPLFADAKAVERAFYEETRIFPIMHLVAIRRDRYQRDPWIAESLYKAFVEAKNRGLAQLRRSGAHAYMLPWIDQDVKEIDEVFGGDPWPYGIDANRATLEALVQYMAEQYLIARPLAIEDLFVPLPGLTGR